MITTEYGRQKSTFEATGTILPPEEVLQRCAKTIADSILPSNTYLEKFNQNVENLLTKRNLERPEAESDQLFRADYPCQSQFGKCPDQCPFTNLMQRRDRARDHSTIHCGLIASSSAVVQDAAFRDEQVEQNSKTRDILCFEMEAYAVAFRQRCLTIRGICDYADSHKIYHWQPYAAIRAAAFTRTVVEILGVIHLHDPPRWSPPLPPRGSTSRSSLGDFSISSELSGDLEKQDTDETSLLSAIEIDGYVYAILRTLIKLTAKLVILSYPVDSRSKPEAPSHKTLMQSMRNCSSVSHLTAYEMDSVQSHTARSKGSNF